MDASPFKFQLLNTLKAIISEASSDERQELRRAYKVLEKLHIDSRQLEVAQVVSDLSRFLHKYIAKRKEPEDYRPRQQHDVYQVGISDKHDENVRCAEEVVEYVNTLNYILGPGTEDSEYQEVRRKVKKVPKHVTGTLEDDFHLREDCHVDEEDDNDNDNDNAW